jgi:benzoate membrane transport protein
VEISVNKNKKELIEKGLGFKSGIKGFKKDINSKSITTAIVAAIFGCTGPALIIIKACTDLGYTSQQTVSWLFGIYFFGGLISLIMAPYYKMPIVGAFSIAGAAMLGTALRGFSFKEAAGAFIIAGVIDLLLGVTGIMSKVMKLLPLPIVMGMIAGAMIKFGIGIVTATASLPIVGGAAIIGFCIIPKFIKKVPPVLASLALGLVAAIATGSIHFASTSFAFVAPQIVIPSFNVNTILSVSVPLAILVVGAENAQGIGVLFAQGYKPPINAMTIITGFGGIITGFFGGHSAHIAGPMTAMCASEEAGEKDSRYTASIINGFLFVCFGLVASVAMAFVKALPSGLTSILAGLAMISVMINSFKDAFSTGKFKTGAYVALIIAMSGVTIFKIGAAFWALLLGVIISLLVEKKDFDEVK